MTINNNSLFTESFNYFTKSHPFHIVAPSDWPFKLALSSSLLMLGLVNYFHRNSGFYSLIAIFLLLLFSFRWINSMRKETISLKIHTTTVQINFLTGMILFIISEIMIFFGFFWAFFHASLNPSIFIGGVWPPLGLEPLNPFKWPFLNTYILLLSGVMTNIFYYSIKSLPDYLDYISFNNSLVKKNFRNYLINNLPNFFFNKNEKLFLKWLNYILLFFIYNKFYFNSKNIFLLIKYIKDLNFFLNFSKYFLIFFESQYNQNLLKNLSLIFNLKKKINFNLLKSTWLKKYHNFFLKNYLLKIIFLFNYSKNLLIIKKFNYFIFLKNKFLNNYFKESENLNKILYNFLKFSEKKFLKLFNCLNFTIILGLLFEKIQWYEYAHASFSISDGVYGTVFFLLTGLHGFHVMVGIFLLFYCWFRFYKKDFLKSIRPHVGISTSVWYWHFVDIVWLFVFFFVYLWSY